MGKMSEIINSLAKQNPAFNRLLKPIFLNTEEELKQIFDFDDWQFSGPTGSCAVAFSKERNHATELNKALHQVSSG